jgi:hypothetical protein
VQRIRGVEAAGGQQVERIQPERQWCGVGFGVTHTVRSCSAAGDLCQLQQRVQGGEFGELFGGALPASFAYPWRGGVGAAAAGAAGYAQRRYCQRTPKLILCGSPNVDPLGSG